MLVEWSLLLQTDSCNMSNFFPYKESIWRTSWYRKGARSYLQSSGQFATRTDVWINEADEGEISYRLLIMFLFLCYVCIYARVFITFIWFTVLCVCIIIIAQVLILKDIKQCYFKSKLQKTMSVPEFSQSGKAARQIIKDKDRL